MYSPHDRLRMGRSIHAVTVICEPDNAPKMIGDLALQKACGIGGPFDGSKRILRLTYLGAKQRNLHSPCNPTIVNGSREAARAIYCPSCRTWHPILLSTVSNENPAYPCSGVS
jgi:hypothetical protein